MMDVGRVCIKIAGRDAGEIAVVVDKIDENFVLVDGNVRRKRCNTKHLEPTEKLVAIQNGASTEDVHAAMKDAGLEVKKKAKQENSEKAAKPKTENPKAAKDKAAKADKKPVKKVK
jgi:large subunit ribosomal protein L14e